MSQGEILVRIKPSTYSDDPVEALATIQPPFKTPKESDTGETDCVEQSEQCYKRLSYNAPREPKSNMSVALSFLKQFILTHNAS